MVQKLFESIDQEDDGEVYLKEVVLFLRAVNADIDANEEVNTKYFYQLLVIDFVNLDKGSSESI